MVPSAAALLVDVLSTIREGVLIFDAKGGLMTWNESARRMLRLRAGERDDPLLRASTEDGSAITVGSSPVAAALVTGRPVRGFVVRTMGQDGEAWLSVDARPLVSEGSTRSHGVVCALTDITQKRRAEYHVAHLTGHDLLTGLPNRRVLEDHLGLALARARRTGTAVGVLNIGLDGFKLVNDSLGRAAGDRLLCDVAGRVRGATRSTDVLARPGGDELLLMLADLDGDAVAAAQRAAAGIVARLAEPFVVGGLQLRVGASIGISVHPEDAVDAPQLLAHADAALGRAKEVARGSWAVYARCAQDPVERLSLATRLRQALEDGALTLHYQPICGLADGSVRAVEALLRWEDPERGVVPPGVFVPLAEQTGLIEALGDWVVRAVCTQQAEWAARGLRPTISFNVSPRQLRRLDFTRRLTEHLRSCGADPARLVVELTESATFEDPTSAEPILRELRGLGLRLALDDFGSGYSSLSRLRGLPVETLKIDRAFLRDVPADPEATEVLRAILRLARALGRATVVEGLETQAQRELLLAEGCELAQGYLLARPMPAAELEMFRRKIGVNLDLAGVQDRG